MHAFLHTSFDVEKGRGADKEAAKESRARFMISSSSPLGKRDPLYVNISSKNEGCSRLPLARRAISHYGASVTMALEARSSRICVIRWISATYEIRMRILAKVVSAFRRDASVLSYRLIKESAFI